MTTASNSNVKSNQPTRAFPLACTVFECVDLVSQGENKTPYLRMKIRYGRDGKVVTAMAWGNARLAVLGKFEINQPTYLYGCFSKGSFEVRGNGFPPKQQVA